MPFAWTLNPYCGCEFGCKYCYARYTHEFMELCDRADFERKIYAKLGAPDLLRAELRVARDKRLPIALGTATDPYQPAERLFAVTRGILQVMADFEGLDISIITKSTLILRDLDLLELVSRKHRLSVSMTVTTLDAGLARKLEPKAPPPAKRLEALRELAARGIAVGVSAAPVLPGLTDSRRSIEAVGRAAAAHGAQFLYANVLFLTPSAMAEFMPFFEKEYPQLARRYRKLYRHSAYLPGNYKEDIAKFMSELRARYSLDGRRNEHTLARRYKQFALNS